MLATVLAGPGAAAAEPAPGAKWKEPFTGMIFVWVPAGCFAMGCKAEQCPPEALPLRDVCLDGFWLARHETTQGQWAKVMDDNPASFQGERRPVENVSWRDASAFAEKLAMLSPSESRFALPSEAQWEYACAAGWPDREPREFARGESTRPVDRGEPNGYGVCNMAGNVREWVRDAFDPEAYAKLGEANPVLEREEGRKVVRGDSWMKAPDTARCSLRMALSPGVVADTVGFRLVRLAPAGKRLRKPPARPSPDQASRPRVLRSIQVERREGSSVLALQADRPIRRHSVFTMDDPARLVLDLAGDWETDVPDTVELQAGGVLRARLGRHEDKLRVVFDLAGDEPADPVVQTAGTELVLRLAGREPSAGPGNVLQGVFFDPSSDGLNMVLRTEAPVTEYSSALRDDPPGLTVTLPGSWRSRAPKTVEGESPVSRVTMETVRDRLVVSASLEEPMLQDPVLIGTRRGLVVSLPAEAFASQRGPGAAAENVAGSSNVLQGVRLQQAEDGLRVQLETEHPVETVELRATQEPAAVLLEAPGAWKSLAPDDRKVESGPVRLVSVSAGQGGLQVRLGLRKPPEGEPRALAVPEGVAALLPYAGKPRAAARKRASRLAENLEERDLPDIQPPKDSVAETFEGLQEQLYFSCSMASASHQTLVWDQKEPRSRDLQQAMAPYKAMFRSMVMEKGGDERTWELVNSPVFDECARMFSEGMDPDACERIRQLSQRRLAQIYAAVNVSGQPRATVRSMIRRFLSEER